MAEVKMLTVDEVKEYEEEIGLRGALKEGEQRFSVTPYEEVTDERNYWTAKQETGDTEPPELTEDEEPGTEIFGRGAVEGESENEQRRREYERRQSQLPQRRPKAEQHPAKNE